MRLGLDPLHHPPLPVPKMEAQINISAAWMDFCTRQMLKITVNRKHESSFPRRFNSGVQCFRDPLTEIWNLFKNFVRTFPETFACSSVIKIFQTQLNITFTLSLVNALETSRIRSMLKGSSRDNNVRKTFQTHFRNIYRREHRWVISSKCYFQNILMCIIWVI